MNYTIHKNHYTSSIKKICIFCIFQPTDMFADYVLHYISELKRLGYEIMLISHNVINNDSLKDLKKACCTIIEKENFGYDFFAWKLGLELCNTESLDHLILTNDSVIGPFADLAPVISKMNKRYDFWGLTDNLELNYHIQSYFIHANKKTLKSESWKNFWSNLQIFDTKADFIKNYEIELTQRLLHTNDNLKIGAWIEYEQLKKKVRLDNSVQYLNPESQKGILNPTIRFWKELILWYDYPFLKKNLLTEGAHYEVLHEHGTYAYGVNPVNWKNTIRQKFNSSAVQMTESFVDTYYKAKVKLKNAEREKYKVLFIGNELHGKTSKADYLIRLLKYYNQHGVATEIIFDGNEFDFDQTLKVQLSDYARLTFLKNLNIFEYEAHKFSISEEKIGSVIIISPELTDLAQNYLFTAAPFLVIANEDDDEAIKTLISKSLREPVTFITPSAAYYKKCISYKAHVRMVEPAMFFMPPIINSSNKGLSTRNQGSITVGFIGIHDIGLHENHVAFLSSTLVNKGIASQCLLFINENEKTALSEILKRRGVLYTELTSNQSLKVVVYSNFTKSVSDHPIDIAVSYSTTEYISNEYLAFYFAQIPVLGFYNKGIHKENLEKGILFSYDYFNTSNIITKLSTLKDHPKQLQKTTTDFIEAFNRYFKSLPGKQETDKFLLREVTDYTETRKLIPRITIIFHFHFYSFDQHSFSYYKKRLREFYSSNVSFLFSITEDSFEILQNASSLKEAFPKSVIKVVPNKGRDIGAKFLLFDEYLRSELQSEYVIVLHDKKSLHLPFGEALAWIESLLKIIQKKYYNAVLHKFESDEKVGIIGSAERITDSILRWEPDAATGELRPVFFWNNDLLQKMIRQYDLKNKNYDFVGGTMFWIKSKLLKEIDKKYGFLNSFEDLEEGNVMDNNGSTITHCWERLLCWIAADLGYKVSGI